MHAANVCLGGRVGNFRFDVSGTTINFSDRLVVNEVCILYPSVIPKSFYFVCPAIYLICLVDLAGHIF